MILGRKAGEKRKVKKAAKSLRSLAGVKMERCEWGGVGGAVVRSISRAMEERGARKGGRNGDSFGQKALIAEVR